MINDRATPFRPALVQEGSRLADRSVHLTDFSGGAGRGPSAAAKGEAMITRHKAHASLLTLIICLGLAVGVIIAAIMRDAIIGVVLGALLIAELWSRNGKLRHP